MLSRDRRAGDLIERPARRIFGIEFGGGESRERPAASWRFAPFPARFGRSKYSGRPSHKNSMADFLGLEQQKPGKPGTRLLRAQRRNARCDPMTDVENRKVFHRSCSA